jgi:hypothetical protein
MKNIFVFILAIFVIIEEWVWDGLVAVSRKLSKLFNLQQLDLWLSQASPSMALFALAIPLILTTPFNVLVVILLANGAIIQAIMLEICVKLVGTLLVGHVFNLVKPALLTFEWFSFVYNNVIKLLQWAKHLVKDTQIYKLSMQVKSAVYSKVRSWFN